MGIQDNLLIRYLSRFLPLTAEEAEAVEHAVPVREFPKGTVLVREGEVAGECYFVLRGCLRQFCLIGAQERNTAFYLEEESATFFESYFNRVPVGQNLVCLEDSILAIGRLDAETDVFARFPRLERLNTLFMEEDMGRLQKSLADFMVSTPEERYLKLLETRPALLQRVPQFHLASYLGIAPESLSRIRRRLSRKSDRN
jgi:CRP-like cAMP-binding protein